MQTITGKEMMNKTEQRFEAAKAAMQGLCGNYEWCKVAAMNLKQGQAIAEAVAVASIELADALLAELARTEPAEKCQWTRDEYGIYSTGCGHLWEFTDGSYQDNSAKFCPYCGKAIAEPAEHHIGDADNMVGLLRPDSEGFW
jgi:hypothetical protein